MELVDEDPANALLLALLIGNFRSSPKSVNPLLIWHFLLFFSRNLGSAFYLRILSHYRQLIKVRGDYLAPTSYCLTMENYITNGNFFFGQTLQMELIYKKRESFQSECLQHFLITLLK